MPDPARPDLVRPDLAATRDALHALAEHVLAGARYAGAGRIGLQVVPGGFATPTYDGGRTITLRADALVVDDGRGTTREAPLTTVRAAADLAGITPRAPDVYSAATAPDLDTLLAVDPDQATRLFDWYALVAEALRRFGVEIAAETAEGGAGPVEQTLWPEHLDVAIRVDGVNYGGLGGDVTIPEPYVYIGPTEVTLPAGDPFWTHPFGAARTWSQVTTVEAVVAFLRQGHEQARRLATAAA